mgnify:FL=1
MDSPYWNVIIRGGSDATVNGVPVEMVVPTNVYSSVFQHLALIARQLGSPVLARGIDETKGGQVAWFTVDADGQAAAAEPVLIPVPSEHATGEPGFTATPESQPPPPASTNWAPPPGDGPTPPINGWTPPAPRRAPVEPLPVEEAPANPIPSPAQTIAGSDRGAPEAQPPAVPGRARGPEPPGFSTAPVPLNASPPSIPQVPANAPPSWGQGFAPREQPVFPNVPQPPDTQATPTAPSPSVLFVRPPKAVPQGGFRGAMYRLTAGRVNFGPSQTQLRVAERDARISRPLTRPYSTAFLSFKGGIGKTSTTVGVGLTLAQMRGAPPIAIDANPDSGDLAERLLGEEELLRIHPRSITDLVRDIPQVRTWTDLTGYIMQIDRLHVLAGEQDPAVSDSLTAEGYTRIHDLVRHFFSVILTDCGTGVTHNAMSGILAKADNVVIAAGYAVSGAKRAASTLDWLAQHGYARLAQEALVVLTDKDGVSARVQKDTVRGHLATHSRQVFVVPNDPAVADGDRINLARVHPRTREAWAEVAAAVIDGYR